MTHRVPLDLGIVYMTSVTPLIEAVEQAAAQALTKADAQAIFNSLESAANHVAKLIYTTNWAAKSACVPESVN